MKKYLCCLLALGLLAGCSVENDDSEIVSPPVEQIPEDNEQDNDEEYKENITNDQKEWIDEIEEVKFPHDIHDDADIMIIYTNGDEFENWYNSNYYLEPSIKNFKINVTSDDAEMINEDIESIYNEYINLSFGVHYQDYRSFKSEKFLSVIRKYGDFLPGSDYRSQRYIYNFNLDTGELLSNQDILDIYHLSVDDIVVYLEDYYDSIESQPCIQEGKDYYDLPEEIRTSCHSQLDYDDAEKIDLFIDENENLIVMHSRVLDNGNDYLSTSFKYNFGQPRKK